MRIMVNIENALSLAPFLWSASVTPEDVRNLSSPLSSAGATSVLLIEGAEYNREMGCLSFPLGSARVLNVGTTEGTVFVGTEEGRHAIDKRDVVPIARPIVEQSEEVRLGFGDRDCIRAFDHLPTDLREAGRQLVEYIRRLDPSGELVHKAPRFVNSPDNWVTLQAQPRVREILITFKGAAKTHLKSASARRPYQGFKVRNLGDMEEAKRVLKTAQRRF